MARINIEDELLIDERFAYVSQRVGRHQAMGQFVFLAKLAQRYWLEGKLIPEAAYRLGDFSDEFLVAGLVEKRDEGYYLKGSEDQFAWIVAKKENGHKGGRPRKNNDIEKATESYAKANESYGNPLTPPLTLPQLNTNVFNITFSELVEIWNNMAKQTDLPTFQTDTKIYEKVSKLSKKPFKDYPETESWERIIEAVPLDGFRLGANDRGWQANLPWLFQKSPTKKIENYVLMMAEWDKYNKQGAA